jgi:hypothetical protein
MVKKIVALFVIASVVSLHAAENTSGETSKHGEAVVRISANMMYLYAYLAFSEGIFVSKLQMDILRNNARKKLNQRLKQNDLNRRKFGFKKDK